MKKSVALLLVLMMVIALLPSGFAAEGEGVTIFYTNDVHTYLNGEIGYEHLVALKEREEHALLVDAGDHIQGTAYGSMDKGKTVIELMNAAGYDLATLGNHEFDYGMDGRIRVTDEWANFPYVSCNFYRAKDGVRGEQVLDAYRVFEVNGMKIAFIGITTPESFSKTTPVYFQDGNGNFIYDIAGGNDGEDLYAAVQAAIDAAKQEADVIIALGHLGVDPSSRPWTSEEVIANTSGLDAFIDGHSHTYLPSKLVADEAGEDVLLTQTGEYFGSIGKMTVSASGEITTELLDLAAVTAITPNAEVLKIKDAWVTELDAKLGEVIGSVDTPLDNYDAEGNRLVRLCETNTGNFVSDALYDLFDDLGYDVDAAIMNGGGIRSRTVVGDISYQTCKEIHPFGNVACLQTVTGQQILDVLEWGARGLPEEEIGGFLHASGLTYEIHTYIPSTVQADEIGNWVGAPTGEYRVQNVRIKNRETGEYEPLDPNGTYNLAGYNYTLRDLGDGSAMFTGAVNVIDYVMEDYMVLANYIRSFEDGKVVGYEKPQGRITFVDRGFTDVRVSDWFHDYVTALCERGLMNGVSSTAFAPQQELTRAMLATILYRAEKEPKVEVVGRFADVSDGAWYADAIEWAAENGIVTGYGENFGPSDPVTREQMVTMLYRYAQYEERDVSVGEDTNILSYEDAMQIQEYAIPAMQWACGEGLLQGSGGKLLPGATATRAQVAKVICLLLEKTAL